MRSDSPKRRWIWASLAGLLLAMCVTAAPRRWYSSSCTGSGACDGDGVCVQGYCARSCTGSDECGGGICIEKHCLAPSLVCKTAHCADANQCTIDLCNPADGSCRHDPASTACDDGDVCTIGDECIDLGGGQAACKAAAKCDDGDPATADSCDKVSGVCNHGVP
ncbi:MAG: hypothetical protein FJ100_07010 [Deltaproteobacteria bacterium]|nr:hypothetical protein [Deltaproteobacteria bacterium]